LQIAGEQTTNSWNTQFSQEDSDHAAIFPASAGLTGTFSAISLLRMLRVPTKGRFQGFAECLIVLESTIPGQSFP
jgi:hypothetical protein